MIYLFSAITTPVTNHLHIVVIGDCVEYTTLGRQKVRRSLIHGTQIEGSIIDRTEYPKK
jgi:hypothetical protein